MKQICHAVWSSNDKCLMSRVGSIRCSSSKEPEGPSLPSPPALSSHLHAGQSYGQGFGTPFSHYCCTVLLVFTCLALQEVPQCTTLLWWYERARRLVITAGCLTRACKMRWCYCIWCMAFAIHCYGVGRSHSSCMPSNSNQDGISCLSSLC